MNRQMQRPTHHPGPAKRGLALSALILVLAGGLAIGKDQAQSQTQGQPPPPPGLNKPDVSKPDVSKPDPGKPDLTPADLQAAIRARGLEGKLRGGRIPPVGARVIVVLVDDPEGQDPSAIGPGRERQQRRMDRVKDRQETFLRRHPRLRRLDNWQAAAVFLVEVTDRAVLLELLDDPDVRLIVEDAPMYPTTQEAMPAAGMGPVSAPYVGTGVVVAVIDHPINHTHPFFGCTAVGTAGCPVAGYTRVDPAAPGPDTTLVSHGTAVGSVVWAAAPGARLWTVDIEDGARNISTARFIGAIDWIATEGPRKNIRIAAAPLRSGIGYPGTCSSSPFTPHIQALRDAGIAFVSATGNEGLPTTIDEPACVPHSIAVTATYDKTDSSLSSACQGPGSTQETMVKDRVACWANRGARVDLVAPGCIILTPAIGNFGCGTSFAAPMVAAAMARIMGTEVGAMLSVTEVVQILKDTGRTVSDGASTYSGKLIQLDQAMTRALEARADWLAKKILPATAMNLALHMDDSANCCPESGGCHQ